MLLRHLLPLSVKPNSMRFNYYSTPLALLLAQFPRISGYSNVQGIRQSLAKTFSRVDFSTRKYSINLKDDKFEAEDVVNSSPSSFASEYHNPVMCYECIDALLDANPRSKMEANHNPRIFVDGTLGGGGHSSALLERLEPGDLLLGCDVDSDALSTASQRLEFYQNHDGSTKPNFVPVLSNFCDLVSKLDEISHPSYPDQSISQFGVDGILLDLGVSSHQIDTAERGFAFLQDGPLDMRMSQTAIGNGLTAADLCNEWSESELKRILRQYGDEPRCRVIAQSIIENRPLESTQDLVKSVAAVVPKFSKQSRRKGLNATLARVFQSLRIVVNREDEVLKKMLNEVCPRLVRPGGRLVVMSYHSMEDRLTKRIMRDGTTGPVPAYKKDIYGNEVGPPKPWKIVHKRRKASDEEVALNSRARSATLRVAERN